jgi:hypothetical protein
MNAHPPACVDLESAVWITEDMLNKDDDKMSTDALFHKAFKDILAKCPGASPKEVAAALSSTLIMMQEREMGDFAKEVGKATGDMVKGMKDGLK